MDDDMKKENFYGKAIGLILGLIACAVMMALTGCGTGRTTWKTERTYRADTVWKIQKAVDSVVVHDSVYMGEMTRNDTVYRYKEVTRWRERLRVRADTVWRERVRTDSVAGTVGGKDKPRGTYRGLATPWERWCYKVGRMATFFAVAVVVALMIWLIKRKRQ